MHLGELADIQMGYPFRSRLEHDPEGDVAVIQMKDIDDANLLQAEDAIRVSLPTGKTRHLLREGDLLFRSRGRSNNAAQVLKGIGPAVLAAPMLLIRPHKVLPAYLCWYINAPATQAQLGALAEGTSVRMISAEAVKALDVPLPSLAVQQHIAQTAALVDREQSLLARIATLRQRATQHLLMKSAHETTP
ncbi:restriction endonuclease subunit S [Marilutibacter alkalisoli]|uniref:Restriction endonuclease subunit S n=1 Tax=Marilutibacter alkalisoli TaxID=2591633 RepID=A0A514BW73_9GAMM|nr:restriction endonuclease subunit S [Lysobacter alkalisoli]QDH71627.1 restriction endonuclease subunit S [Lysobacter alkalisoli]